MAKKQYSKDARDVFGFLASKGLLFVDGILEKPSVKLDLAKVLRIGTEIEPRVLEVLPAALIHFPKTFLNWAALPEKVAAVIASIKNNSDTGPDLAGIPYKAMRRWAHFQMKDRRTVPLNERRVMKSVRFRPSTLIKLKERAKAAGLTETEYLEELICSHRR